MTNALGLYTQSKSLIYYRKELLKSKRVCYGLFPEKRKYQNIIARNIGYLNRMIASKLRNQQAGLPKV